VTATGAPVAAGLPDDDLAQQARPRSLRDRLRQAVDVLIGADPGLNQLRFALQGALGIGLALGLAYLFVGATGALQLLAGSDSRGARGREPGDTPGLDAALRTTLQTVVAGALAVVAGYAVSAARVTWAVLTVFVCFLQASNSGEQVRRAMFRAGGTAVRIVVGDLLVHLTGGQVSPSLLIVLVAMFFGIYLIRINYMFLTVAITSTARAKRCGRWSANSTPPTRRW
jgi:hypothetical protein